MTNHPLPSFHSRSLPFQNRVLLASLLLIMWLVYFVTRASGGLDAISDEYFYMYEDISDQKKRRFFIHLVQSFGRFDLAWAAVSFINIAAVILSFYILSKIYFNNSIVAYLQLIYFPAIASYVFRDSLLLLMLTIMIAALFSKKRRYLFYSIPILFFLFDFRPHLAMLLIVSVVLAYFFEKIKSNFLVLLLVLSAAVSIFLLARFVGEYVHIYGITLNEYLISRSERHGQEYTLVNSVIAFAKHYFAPIPTSLLHRFISGGEISSFEVSAYGPLDDIYRFFYKSSLYFVVLYLLVFWRTVIDVINRRRFETGFLIAFSLGNAIIYSAFSFGVGHERVKIFSTIFLFYLFAGVRHLKFERSKSQLS